MVWVTAACFLLGIVFTIVGNFGVIAFPDPFTRLQASSTCGTTSVFSILIGCIFLTEFGGFTGRIAVLTLFYMITSPVSAHIIGRYAWESGIIPKRGAR